MRMRLSCYLCLFLLVFLGICGGVYAFSGFDLLLFLCFHSAAVYRSALATGLVAALFTVYAAVVFKPFKGLK